jgi:anti-anti-sigma regulatory factor
MLDYTITTRSEAGRTVYFLGGQLDRAAAWALRERIARDAAPEVVLDFGLVDGFSDLGVAVLAHGLTTAPRRVRFRGLRPPQVGIFRYCGVAVEELSLGESAFHRDQAS